MRRGSCPSATTRRPSWTQWGGSRRLPSAVKSCLSDLLPEEVPLRIPKASCSALPVHALSTQRLSESHSCIEICEEELRVVFDLITLLGRQGQSLEAIWETRADELPVRVRCAYNYQAAGILPCADIEPPRKVGMRPRRKAAKPARDRV